MAQNHDVGFEDIDSNIIAKWQGIADLLAKIISVPAALIMKAENEYMEVLVSSNSDNNPYHSGDKEKWHGLYCETVIKTQKELLVPDATSDSHWSKNPDIKLGMIAYLGYPILFPDKRPFGTLCVLDSKRNDFSSAQKSLLKQFCSVLETDISLLEHQRQSEEMFRTIVEGAPDAVFVQIEKRFAYLNSRAVHLFGAGDQKDLLGQPVMERFHPDFHELVLERIAKLNEYQQPVEGLEQKYLRLDGSEVWVEATGQPIEYAGKKGALVFVREITERKDYEKQRNEGFELLINLARLVPGVIYQYRLYPDGSSAFPYASPGMMDIYGVTPEEVREDATPVFGRLHPEDSNRVAEDIFRSVRTLETFYCDFRVILPGKGVCWRWSKAFPERTDDGGTLWHGIIMDVTERKQAEEAIATERERLSVTLRSIGDGVITTDTSGNVVIMNKVAEELTGWSQEQAQGKHLLSVFNIINQNTREPHENPVEKVLATGHTVELENHTLLISQDGTERIIADSGAPIKDKESKTIGVVLVFRDMTEKHRMLDNLQRIDKLDALGVLAGGIAHDFNNLLSGIFGYIDMAKEECTNNKATQDYLDKALNVFDRTKDLTMQLLTFSKGGAPKRKTGQIGNLVKENAAFVLSGSKVGCDVNIDQNLWLCDYDENQIGQVIDNIVLNAQQAMPAGGTIAISVSNITVNTTETLLLKAGNYIKVSITDTGVGIPQNYLQQIFDPFFTTKQKGNGLGLATCYSIVEKHEGLIDVESEPGKGSTFHIYLPATQTGMLQGTSQTTLQHQGSGLILVMDDENYMREIVGDMLATMGYTILKAENGDEALRICTETQLQGNLISGAIFDLTIPGGMGGKETVAKFRESYPDIPIFASSGFSEDPVMAQPSEFGFTDSIRKPFKKGDLAEMLNKYMKPKN